jgi:type IV pilus assembly protein PilW
MNALFEKGFSIIEFMIAISLGALLVAGVATVYLGNRTTYSIQEGLARLQENGRYANYQFNKAVRMAGFQGCAKQSSVSMANLVKNPSAKIDFSNAIFGYEAVTATTWNPALPAYLTGLVKPGTDVIEVRSAGSIAVQLQSNMASVNGAISIYNRTTVAPNDIIVITDCSIGDIIKASTGSSAAAITHTATDNVSDNVSKSYTVDAQVMHFEYSAFYIKDTGRTNRSGQAIFALFQQDINGNETEISEGVEDLQISYGVDTTGDNHANVYQTANTVNTGANWGAVISIVATKLINTINEVNPAVQPYRYNGATITPTDRRLRREWQSFVTLRNRGLE